MAAFELEPLPQQPAPAAPAAPAAPRVGGAVQGSPAAQLQREIDQAMREATQAAQDAAKAQGKTIRIQPGGGVIVSGSDFPAIPGTIAPNPFDNTHLIPSGAVDIAMGFFIMCAVMVVGWPISRALGRRLERRGEMPAAIPATLTEQLQRIEQAVDAMSIEVERISESQRFMAKLQKQEGAERMALPREG